jgi:hypothetical protein
MMVRLMALIGLCAVLGAAPTTTATPARDATVTCEFTPLYLWRRGDATPHTSGPAHAALQGETFTVLGERQTLLGDTLLEVDVPVIETGYSPSDHYWIWSRCVTVSPRT